MIELNYPDNIPLEGRRMSENVEADREQPLDPKHQAAIDKATKIGEAIVKKFPKHTLFVRRYGLGDGGGFVELALRPDGGGFGQEITTAYSDEYFLHATGVEQNVRAKRIYNDFRVHFGLPPVPEERAEGRAGA